MKYIAKKTIPTKYSFTLLSYKIWKTTRTWKKINRWGSIEDNYNGSYIKSVHYYLVHVLGMIHAEQ